MKPKQTLADKLIPSLIVGVFALLYLLYIQSVYAYQLACPDKIDWQLIPRCAEGGLQHGE